MKKKLRQLARLGALTAAVNLIGFAALFAVVELTPLPDSGLVATAPVERDLDEIRSSGVLRVAILPDQVAWTVHRGRQEGFVHDLAREMAAREDLRLEIVRPDTAAAALRDVLSGRADLLALADSGPRPIVDEVRWAKEIIEELPVVVGREANAIRTPEDLRGRRVAVVRHSALEALALEWQRQLDFGFELVRLPSHLGKQDLALGAARHDWPLVLMDGRRARVEAAVYRALEVSGPLSTETLPVRWALRPNAPDLDEMVSAFVEHARVSGLVAEAERRYLENPERLKARRRPVFRDGGPELSPWDGLFRAAGTRHGLDWRLLAALAFAESGYDPWEVSSAGAIGLLQLMPATAEALGAHDPFDPAQNVRAGARHLRWLYQQCEGVEEEDRVAFALAAYNMGLAHVHDAQVLAAVRGLDPDRWDGHVADVLPLLENETIAAELRYGMARGTVTRRYVEHVLDLYERFTATDQQARAIVPVPQGG